MVAPVKMLSYLDRFLSLSMRRTLHQCNITLARTPSASTIADVPPRQRQLRRGDARTTDPLSENEAGIE